MNEYDEIQGILQEIKEIRSDISRMNYEKEFQLKNPLDIISKRIIQNTTIFPIVKNWEGQTAQSASLYGTIFSSDRPLVLQSIAESHGTAASQGTLQFIKMVGVQTISSGSALLATTFDLTATAGTARIRNVGPDGGFSTANIFVFEKGDRLGTKTTGTLASLQDLQVTAYFKQL